MSVEETAEEPRSYPLVLRTPTYHWAVPVIGLVTATFAFLFLLSLAATVDNDPVTWHGLLLLNLVLGALVLVTCGLARVHGVSGKWLMSVQPGIRWRFFRLCLGLAVVAVFAQLLLGVVLGGESNSLDGSANDVDRTLLAIAAVVLLTTPLQAIGEEYLFRGYLMQAFGALTRSPWAAVVITALLFALAHGVQNAPLFLDRFLFGLMAGIVVVRTGGLEAGIALHIWNNLFAFGLALGLGNIDDTLHVSEVSWANLPLSLTQNGVYLLLVLWAANRMGITSRTSGPVLLPTTAPV